jgi:hypothetical protein
MENNNIYTKTSSLTLNNNNPIDPCLNLDNTIQSNELEQN